MVEQQGTTQNTTSNQPIVPNKCVGVVGIAMCDHGTSLFSLLRTFSNDVCCSLFLTSLLHAPVTCRGPALFTPGQHRHNKFGTQINALEL